MIPMFKKFKVIFEEKSLYLGRSKAPMGETPRNAAISF